MCEVLQIVKMYAGVLANQDSSNVKGLLVRETQPL